MTYIPILDLIDTKKEEIVNLDYTYKAEQRALEHKYELAARKLKEETIEQKTEIEQQINKLSQTIELMSLYDGEELAKIIAELLSIYEGVEYHYKKDEEGNYIIADNSITTAQEYQLYAYKLQRDLDKIKHINQYDIPQNQVYLPPREYYTNVLYGYDRRISKVQKTIEDFIDYLFVARIENDITPIKYDDLEIILMSYFTKDDKIEESMARASERQEELKIFNEIHERSHNKTHIELPISYFFKALRELIKKAEADRFSVEHQYYTEDEDLIFEMIVKTHEEVLPRIFDSIQISVGEKTDGHYPRTITFNRVEEHISLLYKYIPRVKKFMENLYSIAILKKKGAIIALDESDIEKAYQLTIKHKAYALTKVKKLKKGV